MVKSQLHTQQGGLVAEGLLEKEDPDQPRRISQFGKWNQEGRDCKSKRVEAGPGLACL